MIKNTFRRIKGLPALLYSKCREKAGIRPVEQFIQGGSKPWAFGYHEYKWEHIEKSVHADFTVLIGTEKYGYRIDERIVELPWLLSRLDEQPGFMLDAGSALNFPIILQHPKIRAKKLFISTLAHEGSAWPELGVSYVYEDLRQTCFRENFFDVIACISTIEHIGMDNTFLYTGDDSKKEQNCEDYLSFLDVMRSRLKPGGSLYVSFPFGKACNHGWFQVLDAAMVDKLIARFQPATCRETIFYYSNDRWHISTREEAAEAACFDINVQKEYEPDYLAFSRSVACLELVK
ncbi:MAG: class I SAM-dependent methyltransferase [Desulfovibrionaceae bacterium]|nr:class I SAM-dependent methyltransferase [Desulfovibrionaceae bacterium]